MHCNIRAIAVALATLALVSLNACTTPTASGGAGRFTPEQPAEAWPAFDTGRQMGTD